MRFVIAFAVAVLALVALSGCVYHGHGRHHALYINTHGYDGHHTGHHRVHHRGHGHHRGHRRYWCP